MITSRSNPHVKRVCALQTQRRARQQEGAFVIEGIRLAQEALSTQFPIQLVLHTEHLDKRARGLLNSLARQGAEVIQVSDAVMATCSSTESPPGLLLVLPIRSRPLPDRLTLALVADRWADPGNLGTLLRTSLAASVEAVFLTEGTVDPFNPKVVRGAMGAHFHLPIATLDPAELPQQLIALELLLAEADKGIPHYQVNWKHPVALIIGGEAHGPQPRLRALASGAVHIPMAEKTESLNAAVAAAVILFEIARQRGTS
jgi:TrmH family RNA methyltransferase